jgi:hypothetical protein
VSERRLAAIVLGLVAYGWLLVGASESRWETPDPLVVTRVHTVTVEAAPELPVATPIADGRVDWDVAERDSECLWVLLQRDGVKVTFENVWALGIWADLNGGACHLIGEDDGGTDFGR